MVFILTDIYIINPNTKKLSWLIFEMLSGFGNQQKLIYLFKNLLFANKNNETTEKYKKCHIF